MFEEKPPPPSEEPRAPTLYDFTQNTTFHGVKYIFESRTILRKLLWLVAVLTACGVFIWQVGTRTYDYYQYDTNVNLQIVYATEMPFPAVTLCNQNNFRTSVAVARGLYGFIDDVYSAHNVSRVDVSKYPIHALDTEEFLRAAAHQITDFIDSCTWQGAPCDIAQDFVTTLTDLGVCYTFNSGHNKPPITVKEAGSAFGLVLILNVEQYEYMRGPQNDAGIKLLLHVPGEVPLVGEQGFAVSPGSHTLAGIDRTVTYNMEPPYGECNASDARPLANCLTHCRRQFVADTCGCMDIYMKALPNATVGVCDMEKQFVCIREQTMEAIRQQSSCACKQLCEYEQFTPRLSYAQLSKFNIERLALKDEGRRRLVNDKFLLARELSQRTDTELARQDQESLQEIQSLVRTLWDDISVSVDILQKDKDFATYNHFVDLLDTADMNLRFDSFVILHRLNDKGNAMGKLETNQLVLVPKFVEALLGNFLEVGEAGGASGFVTRVEQCVATLAFPLPLYDDVHEYFRRRKKRSHVTETTASRDFYSVDVAAYERVHGVSDCAEYVALKQLFATDLLARRVDLDSDKEHAETLYIIMDDLFNSLFHNSSKSPDVFPKYPTCMEFMQYLKVGLFDELDDFLIGLTLFAEASDPGSLMAALTMLASSAQTSDFNVDGLDDACMWIDREYMGELGNDRWLVESSINEMEVAYTYFPSARVSFGNLGEYARQIYTTMRDNVVPRMDLIEGYLNGSSTKQKLAEEFTSLDLHHSMQVLESVSADFVSFSREFDQGIKSILVHVDRGFEYLFNTTIPVINNQVFWDMATVKHFHASGVPEFMDILATYHEEADLGAILRQMAASTKDHYAKAVSDLKLELSSEIEEVVRAITVMRAELQTYVEDSKMDKAFFMENFAQLDIFYPSMSYSEITVQQAFPFISLLSEFGGFMGLLLGASCLTLIEILDHLLSVAWRKLRPSAPAKTHQSPALQPPPPPPAPMTTSTNAWM